jgi:putative transcriptional regulator
MDYIYIEEVHETETKEVVLLTYGSKIRTLCRENGITMSELAEKLGKSKQYISALTNGTIRLRYEMAVQIAEVFNTTPDEIFLQNEDSNSEEEGNG